MSDVTGRFTGRAAEYARHRPGYPPVVVEWMRDVCGMRAGCDVADIGCGTGILAEMLLGAGAQVVGVEPNADMRSACGERLGSRGGLRMVNGTAEATDLADASVDIVVAAQAMHWFDLPRAREEFRRVLRPGGWAVAVWNERRLSGTPFLDAYERLLHEHGTDYGKVASWNLTDERLRAFLGPQAFVVRRADNFQDLDEEGLVGRLLSSSYVPAPGHPKHDAMLAAARDVFARTSERGLVRLAYEVRWYAGRLE